MLWHILTNAMLDIVFDLHTPVIIEKEDYHRTMTGDDFKDNKGFRHRLIAFDEAHASIAPYAHHLRLVLVNEADIKKFEKLCRVSGVPTPISTFKFNIEASRRRLFSVKPLGNIRRWVASLEWATSFQIESLIHNALVNTEDLLETLYRPINNLYKKDSVACADILRTFVEKLQSPSRTTAESPLDCWNQVMKGINDREPLGTPPGMFSCRHVTFTPTRLILEGP
jgi:RNA-dependent RNA polymerase